ncbi:GGDEF domain-containing protein [Priestia abyssalis]|uniref:GGDEF domain-containing protein n=1 Tax=Priestia abyssalis TaxID=1221450 RepID=UPI0009957941|nr:diguanylate cyclase [Priestia abyssalis]
MNNHESLFSIGAVSSVAARSERPEDVIAKADKALYQVKNEGRNQVKVYEPISQAIFSSCIMFPLFHTLSAIVRFF